MSHRPRHVGINALFFEPDRSAGTETYLRGLVPALAHEFPDLQLSVVSTRKGARALRADGWTDFCSIVQLACDEGERAARLWGEQLTYPVFGRRRGWDLLHSLASVGPVWAWTPTVVSVHDVTFFHHRTFGLATTLAMRGIVRRAVRRADALVTGSDASRDDIARTLGVADEHIAVVHHGAGRPVAAVSAAAAERVRTRYALPESARVLLCVGAVRPHKNQGLLVEALRHLPGDVVLVLSGHRESYANDLEMLARRLGVADRVRITGYVGDGDMETLWDLVECAAFPTRGEGFGLPVIEALARGVPVACSDIPVLQEIGGDLPVYFDPDDAEAAARAVERALARRDDVHAAGPAWAGRFTWEAAARGTYEAYERALAGREKRTIADI